MRDRQHLVDAIGVEGGKRCLCRVLAAQIEPDLLARMAHDQAALVRRGQDDEQRGQLQGFERDVDDATYAPDESFLGRLRAAFR